MRAVLDTNIIISAIIAPAGKPAPSLTPGSTENLRS